ncbi:MAG: prolyl-tRNA synthetase [Parcubacteria group bacterium Athens0714_24]|nr:MAG: prolyl-tRNA synthetase [Parcubacteria group bacterium Athens0714_24]
MQSKLFAKTRKEAPKDETAVNAQLLIQAGFVNKDSAGVYTFLPLGLRVLSKIENIVREEMNAIGGQEMLMSALQPKENWQATTRWEGLDILFKVISRHGSEYALGPTHEEIVTPAALNIISSYKDLPLAVYQIQTKFRDEPRAKSGLLRTREFRMKDLYSFHKDEKDLDKYYNKIAIPAYQKIYKRMGLEAFLTEADGGTFSKFSHEFQVEIENGEDIIYICNPPAGGCGLAKNKEIFKDNDECTNCGKTEWREANASEVGNIFPLKNKYSKSFNLIYTAEDGTKKDVIMGCYGMGTSRLMGVLAERFHDQDGIIWPESVAPFKVHLIELNNASAKNIYEDLIKHGVEVLYDDRELSPGEKFADADLIGIPYRVVVSEKTAEQNKFEVKKRDEDKIKLVDKEELFRIIRMNS